MVSSSTDVPFQHPRANETTQATGWMIWGHKRLHRMFKSQYDSTPPEEDQVMIDKLNLVYVRQEQSSIPLGSFCLGV